MPLVTVTVPGVGVHLLAEASGRGPGLPLRLCSAWKPEGCSGHRNMALPVSTLKISRVGAAMKVMVCEADELLPQASVAV